MEVSKLLLPQKAFDQHHIYSEELILLSCCNPLLSRKVLQKEPLHKQKRQTLLKQICRD